MEKPAREGEKRTAVWASQHEERGSDDGVAPPVGDHRVVPHRWGVFDQCNASGSAMNACSDIPAMGATGLRARRRAVLWTFREPSLCRHVHRALLRNAVLDVTPIILATACHQSNDVETYSRGRIIARFQYISQAFHR
jgi:hypothetical protein